MQKLGIVYDQAFMEHNPGPWHPESPRRLAAVKAAIDSLDIETVDIVAREATREELLLIHTPDYVDQILSLHVPDIVHLDADTAVSPGSLVAALKAAGGVIAAVDCVMKDSPKVVFCAIRPPGHHAEPDRAMGFCIFNNVAIGAAYALKRYGLKRVAILDWDLHHGNGTQDAFYGSSEVLYISLHQAPYYPMTGETMESGECKGVGFTINIPMVAGSSDVDYRAAFQEMIIPALGNFEPELVMISAGFDAHMDDPLGDLYLTSAYFGEMTRLVKAAAAKSAGGRIVSVLEGGYNLQALRESVAIHLKELSI